jgi:hypothetical protein
MGLMLTVFLRPAPAVETSATSRTYVQARETVEGDNAIPAYEYLDLDVVNAGMEGIELHAGGWGRLDLGDNWSGDDTESELNYGYVRFRYQDTARVDVGRFFANEGFISEQVNGGRVMTEASNGLGLSVFGGNPVENDTGDLEADSIYGGRAHLRWKNNLEVGVSYLTQDGETDKTDREEGGFDVWFMPTSSVQLQGLSSYNYDTEGWMEHSYHLFLRPADSIMVTGEYSFIDYENFFTDTTLSVFDLSSLDRKEKLTTSGGSVDFYLSSEWTLTALYKNYSYDQSGDAAFYGGDLTYNSSGYAAGLSVNRMDGDSDDLRYTHVSYDEELFGTDAAYALSGAATYNVLKNLQVGADVEYGKNQWFDEQTKGFLKIIYHFQPSGGEA